MEAIASSQGAQEESERRVGARQMEARASLDLADDCLQDVGRGIVLVRAHPDAVNDVPNPLADYEVTEIDGSPPASLGDEPLRCEICGRLFVGAKAWSSLFAHQGVPCHAPETPDDAHPLRVSFPASLTPLLRRVLDARGLRLEDRPLSAERGSGAERHRESFLVDLSLLRRTLRQLAFTEASGCNLERWHGTLHEHTAESTFVQLEDADLVALQKLHAAWHVGHCHSVDVVTLARHGDLERRLQETWVADPGARCFVKTSMRSPKDAVRVEHPEASLPHERLRTELEACAVTTAGAAVELLAASKRVMEDISHFMRYRTDGDRLNIVIRKWDEAVVGSIEWRCFVSDGRLTAISQYHCYTAQPQVVEACAGDQAALYQTRDRLIAFQERIHGSVLDCLGLSSYVLDLATDASEDAGAPVRLVEINPFDTSGAALFTWRKDRGVLVGGRSDGFVEFRVACHIDSDIGST